MTFLVLAVLLALQMTFLLVQPGPSTFGRVVSCSYAIAVGLVGLVVELRAYGNRYECLRFWRTKLLPGDETPDDYRKAAR